MDLGLGRYFHASTFVYRSLGAAWCRIGGVAHYYFSTLFVSQSDRFGMKEKRVDPDIHCGAALGVQAWLGHWQQLALIGLCPLGPGDVRACLGKLPGCQGRSEKPEFTPSKFAFLEYD